jgi:ABC-type nitrate/sulfonate/bicarbonate transport system ATPase subunit
MQRRDKPNVSLRDVSFGYDSRKIIDGLNLSLQSGQITAMLGPSGSGKTTLLRLIAGMEQTKAGVISISAAPDQTPLSYMFQDYDTFPWLTVLQNLLLSGESHLDLIRGAAEQIGLTGLLDRYPRQLSGGQRKRVALARSLLARPALLILDEPFGSLDVKTKFAIFDILETAFLDGTWTGLFVTHSVEEAVILSDRVIILSGPPLSIKDDISIAAPRPRKGDFLDSEMFKTTVARIMQLLLSK